MAATNRILLILDLIRGLIAIIAGNIGFPTLVLYLIGMMQPAHQTVITIEKALVTALCLILALYCFHTTGNKVIKAVIVIFIFIPVILMLLSFFAVLKVPLPF